MFETVDLSEFRSFSDFDAVHCWSVLSFMDPSKQIDVLSRITSSSATLIDTNFTIPRPEFCARSFYKRFSGDCRLTSIGFPYLSELPPLSGHEVSTKTVKYAGTLLTNRSGSAEAIEPRAERSGFLQRLYKKNWRTPRFAIEVKIRPNGWKWSPPVGDAQDGMEIMRQYMALLR